MAAADTQGARGRPSLFLFLPQVTSLLTHSQPSTGNALQSPLTKNCFWVQLSYPVEHPQAPWHRNHALRPETSPGLGGPHLLWGSRLPGPLTPSPPTPPKAHTCASKSPHHSLCRERIPQAADVGDTPSGFLHGPITPHPLSLSLVVGSRRTEPVPHGHAPSDQHGRQHESSPLPE